jgi:uncharacterized cupredoxin-like copper-binding protein
MRSRLIGGVGTAAALVLASCGTGGGGRPLAVRETDYAIKPNASTVAHGKVKLTISNAGPTDHELLIFKTDLPEDKLPLSGDQQEVNEDAIPKVFDTEADLPAGTHRQVSVTLAPGRYVLVCNLPGHYLDGMHTTIVSS